MRKFIVNILATAASFYIAQSVLRGGIHLEQTWTAYLITSLVFVIFNMILSPVIKLLLLPINLLTLGLFRWLTNVLVLYLFDILYSGISIVAFNYPGFNSSVLALPTGYLNLFWVLVIASLLMSLTYSVITALFQAEE